MQEAYHLLIERLRDGAFEAGATWRSQHKGEVDRLPRFAADEAPLARPRAGGGADDEHAARTARVVRRPFRLTPAIVAPPSRGKTNHKRFLKRLAAHHSLAASPAFYLPQGRENTLHRSEVTQVDAQTRVKSQLGGLADRAAQRKRKCAPDPAPAPAAVATEGVRSFVKLTGPTQTPSDVTFHQSNPFGPALCVQDCRSGVPGRREGAHPRAGPGGASGHWGCASFRGKGVMQASSCVAMPRGLFQIRLLPPPMLYAVRPRCASTSKRTLSPCLAPSLRRRRPRAHTVPA